MKLREECTRYSVGKHGKDYGTVYFKRDYHGNYANSFDSGWIDSLIADLQAAKEFIKNLKEEP